MLYAIKAETLIDGSGKAPLEKAMVLVEENKIKAVGRQSEIAVPDGYKLIDAKTLMPGLIDCHVHIQHSGDPQDRFDRTSTTPAEMALNSLRNANRSLRAGFTTLRNCATDFYADVDVRDAIYRGDFMGPRIWCSGVGLTSTRGHMDRGKLLPHHVKLDMPTAWCDSPDQARQAIMKNLNENVDFIKMNITISENVRRYRRECAPEMTKDVMKAAIEWAHYHGRKVTAHCHGGIGVTWAIEAGIDGLEHAYFIDESQMELMVKNNVTMCPTISTIAQGFKNGSKNKEGPDLAGWYDLVDEKLWTTVSKAKKAGVRIIAGTDASMPYTFHGNNATELEYLVERCGLTPMEAIYAATGSAADAFDMPGVGYVKPGKFADLLMFDGNPLEDVKQLQNHDKISMVMVNGKIAVNRVTGQIDPTFK